MKVKRFENIWTMGLILCIGLLVVFYVAKLFFPHWIVGVAETPNIVKIGNYIDAHPIAYYLFEFFNSLIFTYLYCGACCRKYKLSYKSVIAISVAIIVLLLTARYLSDSYSPLNYTLFAILPFIVCILEKNVSNLTFASTMICYSVDIFSQEMSRKVRDITTLASCVNSATFFILLIDVLMWRVLLYLFFNNKRKEN